MPLRIDEVETEMEVTPGTAPPADAAEALARAAVESRSALRELLRPLVLEILTEELESLRRRHG